MVNRQGTSIMLLFLYAMLIVALLVLAVVGARLYSNALDAKSAHSSRRVALSYIQSQTAGFSADRVELKEGPEGTMLCLKETDGSYETRIYLYDNALYSEFCTVESAVSPASGQKICGLKELNIHWQDMEPKLLCIDAGGIVGYVCCYGGEDHA